MVFAVLILPRSESVFSRGKVTFKSNITLSIKLLTIITICFSNWHNILLLYGTKGAIGSDQVKYYWELVFLKTCVAQLVRARVS